MAFLLLLLYFIFILDHSRDSKSKSICEALSNAVLIVADYQLPCLPV